MKKNSLTRRISGAILAASLSLAGLAVAGGIELHDEPDQVEEVAGATWSRPMIIGGKGGAETQGATWS